MININIPEIPKIKWDTTGARGLREHCLLWLTALMVWTVEVRVWETQVDAARANQALLLTSVSKSYDIIRHSVKRALIALACTLVMVIAVASPYHDVPFRLTQVVLGWVGITYAFDEIMMGVAQLRGVWVGTTQELTLRYKRHVEWTVRREVSKHLAAGIVFMLWHANRMLFDAEIKVCAAGRTQTFTVVGALVSLSHTICNRVP